MDALYLSFLFTLHFYLHLLGMGWHGEVYRMLEGSSQMYRYDVVSRMKVLTGNGYLLVEMLSDGIGDFRQVVRTSPVHHWRSSTTTIHGNIFDKSMITMLIM